jgi:glycosyltransferase involved in cell wall biosynthesis
MLAADITVAVSAPSAAELEGRYGARDVRILRNPAPLPPATDGAGRSAVQPPHVLYLGGFANAVKGGDVLVRALPGLLERCPDATFALAGPGEPPAALAEVDGGARVRWRGWLDEPAKHAALAAADVFVLPSTSEGLPIAILEAMTHGAAIVATRVGGVPDVLVHGEEGLIVPPGDAEALTAALTTVLSDRALAAALGAAAQRRAAEFHPERIADELDAMYREVLGGARRG